MYVSVSVCYICMYVLKEAKRGGEVSLGLEFQVVVNSPTWVLRSERGESSMLLLSHLSRCVLSYPAQCIFKLDLGWWSSLAPPNLFSMPGLFQLIHIW